MIAMEALDQLLMACHSQSIKPFVESFLHMVAKLLESREPDLQVLGTNSVRTPPSIYTAPYYYIPTQYVPLPLSILLHTTTYQLSTYPSLYLYCYILLHTNSVRTPPSIYTATY